MNLNQLTIPVAELERSVAFYQKLGLQLIVLSRPYYARFACADGPTTFSLHLAEGSINSGCWIYFEIENLDQKVHELQKQGFDFEELPNDKPWLWREARLRDPDGHQLILYYAGQNRLNPPWRIKD
jgi:catechol 2,3-dioxygenase-like lactoylglutathione lyase family enzyme